MSSLEKFTGNILTKEEKEVRLKQLKEMIRENDVDKEFIPYLNKINSYDFICTTQCCMGHNGNNNRCAYLDFRSGLSERDTIDKLLRPMEDKYSNLDSHLSIQLYTECNKLRYCLWLNNKIWEEQIKYFIKLLEQIEK